MIDDVLESCTFHDCMGIWNEDEEFNALILASYEDPLYRRYVDKIVYCACTVYARASLVDLSDSLHGRIDVYDLVNEQYAQYLLTYEQLQDKDNPKKYLTIVFKTVRQRFFNLEMFAFSVGAKDNARGLRRFHAVLRGERIESNIPRVNFVYNTIVANAKYVKSLDKYLDLKDDQCTITFGETISDPKSQNGFNWIELKKTENDVFYRISNPLIRIVIGSYLACSIDCTHTPRKRRVSEAESFCRAYLGISHELFLIAWRQGMMLLTHYTNQSAFR